MPVRDKSRYDNDSNQNSGNSERASVAPELWYMENFENFIWYSSYDTLKALYHLWGDFVK